MLTFRAWYPTARLCVCSLPGQAKEASIQQKNSDKNVWVLLTVNRVVVTTQMVNDKRVIALCKAWGPRLKWTDSGRSPRVSCRECSINTLQESSCVWLPLLLLRLSGEISDGDFRYLVITLRFLVRSSVGEEAVKTSSSPNLRKKSVEFRICCTC